VRLRAALIPFVAALVFLVDQVSKYLVATYLEVDQPWYPFAFLKPIFSLTYIHNTGAAFGILQNQNLFFSVVAIIVIAIIVVYLRSTPQPDVLVAVSLALQLGGACGNLADRLRYGYVTDFLYIQHFAVSNFADMCISLGVVLLGYHLIFRMQQVDNGQTTPPDSSSAAVPQESSSSDQT
jgi:signal peptidase II